MGKHKIVKSAAAVALTASVVATAAAPGASAASYKTNAKDQLVYTKSGKLVKGWKVFGGKLYKNGKLAPAKKYKIIGTGAAQKLFYGPTLKKGYKTANSKTLLFKDGKLADGWKQAGKNERLYKNGKLDKGYTVYTNVEGDKFLYQNGKLKKGQKTATRGGETLLFVDGKLAKGYVLHEASKTLFNNGKVAEGLVKYPETDGKFYNDGKLANGEINGATYKDGVLVAKDVASVKAINDTTVEVTFKEAQKADNIKAGDFKIEGLTISNAALKQTDDKVVVLTTSKQEAGKEYTIVYKETDTKTFTGFNAALPTAIASTTIKPYQTSQQSIIGKEVTVKASVTVPEGASKAGIPVTFVIDSEADKAGGQFGKDQTVEVFTDENGVASYTYTQYQGGTTDTVTAYPTGAPTQRTATKVYWGTAAERLTVAEVTEGTTLANNAKKVYKVTGAAGQKVNITFAENYEVTPDKVDYKATVEGKTPFQTSIAGKVDTQNAVSITLDNNGVGTFTVTGSNTSVTPVVFVDNGNDRLGQTELQASAATVKFDNIKTVGLTNQAQGTQKAAAGKTDAFKTAKMGANQGGRTYVATLTDNDGKTAPADTAVYLTFSDEKDKAAAIKGKLHVYDVNGNEVTGKDGVYTLKTDKNGKVTYAVASEVTNNYATPVVFLENGSKAGLDPQDSQAAGEITYFGDEAVSKATVKFYDANGAEVSSIKGAGTVKVEYQTVDQNGFAYTPAKSSNVTFNFDTTFGTLTANGTVVATGNTNNNSITLPTDQNGLIKFDLTSDRDTKVNIQASGSEAIIDNVKASFEFTSLTVLPNVYTGKVTALDKKKKEIKLDSKDAVSYENANYKNASGVAIDLDTFLAQAGVGAEVTYKKVGDVVTFEIVKASSVVTPPTETATAKAYTDAVKAIPALKEDKSNKAEVEAAIVKAEAAAKALTEADKATEAVKAADKTLAAAKDSVKDETPEGDKVKVADLLAAKKATIDTDKVTDSVTLSFLKTDLPASFEGKKVYAVVKGEKVEIKTSALLPTKYYNKFDSKFTQADVEAAELIAE